MSEDAKPLVLEGAAEAQQKEGYDLQLFNAGETIELLSQLLAVALVRLGSTLEVTDEEIRAAIAGKELGHGWNTATGKYTVALRPAEPAKAPN